MRLGRIGFDQVVGYVEDSEQLFAELADLVTSSERLTVEEFERRRAEEPVTVLDVHNPGERELGAIPGSQHIPLAELIRRHDELGSADDVIVHRAGDWRSSVGDSLLPKLGYGPVTDLLGGYDQRAQQHADQAKAAMCCPLSSEDERYSDSVRQHRDSPRTGRCGSGTVSCATQGGRELTGVTESVRLCLLSQQHLKARYVR